MLAGLSQEERSQLGLEGFTVRDLLYLNMGDTRQVCDHFDHVLIET